jgi:acyl-CoA thioesterase-1
MLISSIIFLCALSRLSYGEGPGVRPTVRYLPIGDSYTIGEGLDPKQNFPSLLVNHLRQSGVTVDLLGNPARTGWTTQDAINNEVPLFKKLKPEFSTLLIGVNDWVQGVNETTFQKNLSYIIDEMQKIVSSKLILITIPDFSATPNGGQYGKGRNISEGIASFNRIIIEEARKRRLPVVDIFKLSQEMKNDPSLVAADGLHPSAKEYEKWEELIYKEAIKLLAK